jgi:hypothetical protein
VALTQTYRAVKEEEKEGEYEAGNRLLNCRRRRRRCATDMEIITANSGLPDFSLHCIVTHSCKQTFVRLK